MKPIDGPLEPLAQLPETLQMTEEEAPQVECPRCGHMLVVVRAMMLAGVICGMKWTLTCPSGGEGEMFTYVTARDFHDELYGADL